MCHNEWFFLVRKRAEWSCYIYHWYLTIACTLTRLVGLLIYFTLLNTAWEKCSQIKMLYWINLIRLSVWWNKMLRIMKICFPLIPIIVVATYHLRHMDSQYIQIMLSLKKINRMDSIINMMFYRMSAAFLNSWLTF